MSTNETVIQGTNATNATNATGATTNPGPGTAAEPQPGLQSSNPLPSDDALYRRIFPNK